MEKNSTYKDLKEFIKTQSDPELKQYWEILLPFFNSYKKIVADKDLDHDYYASLLVQYCKLVIKQVKDPCKFESYHLALREPIDYVHIGTEIFRPLINKKQSTLSGKENLKEIQDLLSKGENVFLYANHQIEADPQVLRILLEDDFPGFGEEISYVAGVRVLTDPLAVPFSLGCHLFCIYSKKYFSANPKRAGDMKLHNQKTVREISSQLNIGGKCIYIAPSGGRDRKGDSGNIEVSPFDPQSVELMYLLGKKAKKTTHFYPLALSTHDTLPPPEGLQVSLGEPRSTNAAPIHAHFGKKINMDNFPFSDTTNKKKMKDARTQYIYNLVSEMYAAFPVESS